MPGSKGRTGITFFALATGAVPGFPQGGAAVRLQRGPVDVDLAVVIDNLEPAGALDRLCVLQWDIFCSFKSHFSSMNNALAHKCTYLGVQTGARWLTYALQARAVQRTARRTQTHKGPLAVPAISVNTGVGLALVHVWRDRSKQLSV